MAKLMGGIGAYLYGTLDELSYYRMKGVDKTIVRKKGGHTKAKVKKMPNVKRAISEFSGRSTASKYLRMALAPQVRLAGRNLAGTLNALMTPVQQMDTVSDWGKRNVTLSKYPHILTGFSLNRTHLFDSVIRYPLSWSIQRDTGTATVHIPELVPGLNLKSEEKYPYYSLVVSLGVMPDLFWNKARYLPASLKYFYGAAHAAYSEWYPLLEGSPAIDLSVSLLEPPPADHCSLVLAVGICYGQLLGANHIGWTTDAGSAKVLEVV